MKQFITQSQGSMNESHNRVKFKIPRKHLEEMCYNVNMTSVDVSKCPYVKSRDCPGECKLFNKKFNYKTGLERFETSNIKSYLGFILRRQLKF